MTVGIVMLVHNAFDRAEDVVRHWVKGGCPVVVHIDKNVTDAVHDEFVEKLADLKQVKFCKRHPCEWGTWGIVAAAQSAATLLLSSFPDVRHAYLASGSCMPLRPVSELVQYLDSRPRTDFIESATTADVPWTVGGLDAERFTLRFPFSWKTNRRMFDFYVKLQRAVRFKRKIPAGLVPHMGSQWWCLTRQTLTAMLQDPEREEYDRYFKRVWIPDESYFQTLVRLYSGNIESRSLTLSKFDFQGKPHIFYDDHLQLLRRSDCFVARKIWPNATRLYNTFLSDDASAMKGAEPNPAKIDRIFLKQLIAEPVVGLVFICKVGTPTAIGKTASRLHLIRCLKVSQSCLRTLNPGWPKSRHRAYTAIYMRRIGSNLTDVKGRLVVR